MIVGWKYFPYDIMTTRWEKQEQKDAVSLLEVTERRP